MLVELETITDNIERVNTKVAEHKANMATAQQAINNYMPIYKSKVKQLESNIYRLDINDTDFKTVSDAIITQLDEQNKELKAEVATESEKEEA